VIKVSLFIANVVLHGPTSRERVISALPFLWESLSRLDKKAFGLKS
jgi:hypothetical protein